MSIITFVADNTLSLASRTNSVIPLPTGSPSCSIKFIGFAPEPGVAITPPASFVAMTGSPYTTPSIFDANWYYTLANDATFTITHSAMFTAAYIASYVGGEPAAPVDVDASTATGSSTTCTASAVTTVRPYVMRMFLAMLSDVATTSQPTGMTEREDGNGNGIAMFEELQAVPGTSGSEATTLGTSREWAAIHFGQRPRAMRLASCGAG